MCFLLQAAFPQLLLLGTPPQPHPCLISDWGLAHSRCSVGSAAWVHQLQASDTPHPPTHTPPATPTGWLPRGLCSLWFLQSPSQLWGIGGLGRISLPTEDEVHLPGSRGSPALRVKGRSPTTLLGRSILGQKTLPGRKEQPAQGRRRRGPAVGRTQSSMCPQAGGQGTGPSLPRGSGLRC